MGAATPAFILAFLQNWSDWFENPAIAKKLTQQITLGFHALIAKQPAVFRGNWVRS